MTSGIDDFIRDAIRFVRPDAPMVVSADRSGIVMVEQEPDEAEADTSRLDLERRMNEAGHQPGEEESPAMSPETRPLANEAEAELAEEPRIEVEDRGRGEVVASIHPASTVRGTTPSPPDAPATPSLPAQDERSGPEDGDGATGTPVERTEPLMGTLATVVPQSPSGIPVSYVDDDPEDARRLAPDPRRCTEVMRDGKRCRSYALKGAVQCAGHAGLGLSADPHAASALAAQQRTRMKETRMLVGAGSRMGPRAALRLAALEKAAPLAERILATALDPEGGASSANVALRIIDAIDPLVTVEAITTTEQLIAKVQSGADPSWSELRAVFAPDPGVTAAEAEALSAAVS